MTPRIALAMLVTIGCYGEPEAFGPKCTRNAGVCRSGDDVTRSVSTDSAGRVATTAREVWPALASQPKLPPPAELARACVRLHSCTLFPMKDCLAPPPSEENGVPFGTSNERVLFLVLAALDPANDCAALKKLQTERSPSIKCESHGCEWLSATDPVPTVTCAGTVATLTAKSGTSTRDCSHAFAECDPASPTGCTDRPLIKCPSTATDSCDGDVQLGCRQIGFVSFRNCALYGGTCEPTGMAGNATCTYAETCPTVPPSCNGTAARVCTMGQTVEVDCKSLGFTSCTAGACR